MLRTIQEADAVDLDEEIFRDWAAGESVACRLPHPVHTWMLELPTTGKMREMNFVHTPATLSIHEPSFGRRLIGIQKNASFTSDPNEVDPANKVCLPGGDLRVVALFSTISENTLSRGGGAMMLG